MAYQGSADKSYLSDKAEYFIYPAKQASPLAPWLKHLFGLVAMQLNQ